MPSCQGESENETDSVMRESGRVTDRDRGEVEQRQRQRQRQRQKHDQLSTNWFWTGGPMLRLTPVLLKTGLVYELVTSWQVG